MIRAFIFFMTIIFFEVAKADNEIFFQSQNQVQLCLISDNNYLQADCLYKVKDQIQIEIQKLLADKKFECSSPESFQLWLDQVESACFFNYHPYLQDGFFVPILYSSCLAVENLMFLAFLLNFKDGSKLQVDTNLLNQLIFNPEYPFPNLLNEMNRLIHEDSTKPMCANVS